MMNVTISDNGACFMVCVNVLFTDEMFDRALEIAVEKQDRWLKRLQERENKNGKPE